MELQDLLNAFPLEGVITSDIIEMSNIADTVNCIGANTLKEALLEKGLGKFVNNVSWGDVCGTIWEKPWNNEGSDIISRVTTEEGLFMMNVTNSQKVTFILQ